LGYTLANALCAKCFSVAADIVIANPILYDPSVVEETLKNDKGSIETLPYYWLITYAFG
jgi:hypothetical protein